MKALQCSLVNIVYLGSNKENARVAPSKGKGRAFSLFEPISLTKIHPFDTLVYTSYVPILTEFSTPILLLYFSDVTKKMRVVNSYTMGSFLVYTVKLRWPRNVVMLPRVVQIPSPFSLLNLLVRIALYIKFPTH